ncbi:MAG: hypothetical protein Q8S27_09235 [Hoeflea sp.]|uniref:hypothetical protein n=1 Tax=Hoeflea sp. TaxID=1940281 RepID=UPI002731DFB9|nr:hypothetical protein [Hoeflea sp.]MDP2122615.1 hypothetical protein [Hoeflea sp.]MDP3524750.1 hypothetical protein [Hoeflea sp.]
MMTHDIDTVIAGILEDPALDRSAKIEKLQKMRQDTRAEMRAASESAMVDDVDTGDHLKHLDLALRDLGADHDSIEDRGAATL